MDRSETEVRCNDGWEDSLKDERETLAEVEASGDDGRTVDAWKLSSEARKVVRTIVSVTSVESLELDDSTSRGRFCICMIRRHVWKAIMHMIY